MESTSGHYQFRYADAQGTVVRSTFMHCDADDHAIRQARATMQDKYASLEIFAGERVVYASWR
jgi:hypothetical protein